MDQDKAIDELMGFLKDNELPVDKIAKIAISRLGSQDDEIRLSWSCLVALILDSPPFSIGSPDPELNERYRRFSEILSEDIEKYWKRFTGNL